MEISENLLINCGGGEELIYTYNGKKYFSQGYILENGLYRFELQQWEPEGKMLWYVEGLDHQSSLDKFLEQPLFDGKRFWDAEQEMEWVSSFILDISKM